MKLRIGAGETQLVNAESIALSDSNQMIESYPMKLTVSMEREIDKSG